MVEARPLPSTVRVIPEFFVCCDRGCALGRTISDQRRNRPAAPAIIARSTIADECPDREKVHDVGGLKRRPSAHRVIDWNRLTRRVKSCVVCGSHQVATRWDDPQTVTVGCRACGCIVRIEFDPPDAPGVRGRIEALFAPPDDDPSLDD
jgi:hypothetical protein